MTVLNTMLEENIKEKINEVQETKISLDDIENMFNDMVGIKMEKSEPYELILKSEKRMSKETLYQNIKSVLDENMDDLLFRICFKMIKSKNGIIIRQKKI